MIVDLQNITPYLWDKYPKEFNGLQSVISHANEFINTFQVDLDLSDQETGNVVLSLYTRAANNLFAASILLETGFGVQATTITRSLFEDMVNITYFLAAPDREETFEGLAKRYVDYAEIEPFLLQIKLHENVEEYELDPEVLEEYRARIRNFSEKYNGQTTDWSGLKIYMKAKKAGNDVAQMYYVSYPEFCWSAHGGPTVSNQFMSVGQQSSIHSCGPNDIQIQRPILALCTFFLICQSAVTQYFNILDFKEKTHALQNEIAGIWKEIKNES